MDTQSPNDAIGNNCRSEPATSAAVPPQPAASVDGTFVVAANRPGFLSLAKYGTYAPDPNAVNILKLDPQKPVAYGLHDDEELTN